MGLKQEEGSRNSNKYLVELLFYYLKLSANEIILFKS